MAMDARTVSLSARNLYEQPSAMDGNIVEEPASPTPVITVHLDADEYSSQEANISPGREGFDNSQDYEDDPANPENGDDDMMEEPNDSAGPKAHRLDFWQNQIRQNVRGSYYTVGQALYRVLHTERLLKTANFIKWAHSCFGLTRSTAYEYIRAYRIVQLLQSQDTSLPVPSTLSHFRVFNKTKLKDGGAEVTRLWRTILEELPPDSHQKPHTAKEVLSKGKEIMEREKLGDHAQRMNGLLPGRSPVLVGKRPRSQPDVFDPAGWQQPDARRSPSLAGSMDDLSSASPTSSHAYRSTTSTSSENRGSASTDTTSHGGNGYATQQHAAATSSRWQNVTRSSTHRDRSGFAPVQPRRSQRVFSAESELMDDSGEPPALIPFTSMVPKATASANNVLKATTIVSMAQRVVQNGKFNLSLTPPQSLEEAKALSSLGMVYRSSIAQQSDEWRGCIWGNFSGPLAEEQMSTVQLMCSAVEKFDCGAFDEAVFLTNIDFAQEWFQKLLQYPHCFLKKYVACSNRFYPEQANGTPKVVAKETVRRSCALFYLGSNSQKFVEEFRGMGMIPGVSTWCNYSGDGSAP